MEIRRITAGDVDGAAALILSILTQEFDFPVTRADLTDIDAHADFYGGDSGLWIAAENGRVVGTIALKTFGTSGALRRMFVAADRRGRDHGVGGKLLRTLTDHAVDHRLADIWLGTTQAFAGAHRFYEKNGFVRVGKTGLPSGFPAMALDDRFYRLNLTAH